MHWDRRSFLKTGAALAGAGALPAWSAGGPTEVRLKPAPTEIALAANAVKPLAQAGRPLRVAEIGGGTGGCPAAPVFWWPAECFLAGCSIRSQ